MIPDGAIPTKESDNSAQSQQRDWRRDVEANGVKQRRDGELLRAVRNLRETWVLRDLGSRG
jgi:hypothetical protein